jgi:hypothetical protein
MNIQTAIAELYGLGSELPTPLGAGFGGNLGGQLFHHDSVLGN